MVNLQEFAATAVSLIKEKLVDQMVAGIQYEKINAWFEMTQLETEVESWMDYLEPAVRPVYDHVAFDSEVGQQFVRALERRDDVKLYFETSRIVHSSQFPRPWVTTTPGYLPKNKRKRASPSLPSLSGSILTRKRKGFRVVKEFVDVETANSAGRTHFQEMVKILQGNSDGKAILVEKTDRLYRNFKDDVLLEDLDLAIHLVKEGGNIDKESRSHVKFIHGIKVLMAKNFIDNLSEEVRKGMREKAEQGDCPSRPPQGYQPNLQTNCIELDPERAEKE